MMENKSIIYNKAAFTIRETIEVPECQISKDMICGLDKMDFDTIVMNAIDYSVIRTKYREFLDLETDKEKIRDGVLAEILGIKIVVNITIAPKSILFVDFLEKEAIEVKLNPIHPTSILSDTSSFLEKMIEVKKENNNPDIDHTLNELCDRLEIFQLKLSKLSD